MRWRAAAVGAVGLFGSALLAARVGQTIAPRLPVSASPWILPLTQVGAGAVLGMLSKRALVSELANGAVVGGMSQAIGAAMATVVGAGRRVPGGA